MPCTVSSLLHYSTTPLLYCPTPLLFSIVQRVLQSTHSILLLLYGRCPASTSQVGVGDLPIFTQLLGDGRSPYQGPAALIGLDVLSQRRVVIGAGTGKRGRERQLLVSKA